MYRAMLPRERKKLSIKDLLHVALGCDNHSREWQIGAASASMATGSQMRHCANISRFCPAVTRNLEFCHGGY